MRGRVLNRRINLENPGKSCKFEHFHDLISHSTEHTSISRIFKALRDNEDYPQTCAIDIRHMGEIQK